MIKRPLLFVLGCAVALFLTSCGGTDNESQVQSNSPSQQADAMESNTQQESTPELSDEPAELDDSHILVAYFSMAGEQYEVGLIEKGNTEIVAEMIAEATGADIFPIQPVTPYPDTYDELLEISQQESMNDPPEIAETVENMEQYDTVFIGYPIWWGDIPAIVAGFLGDYDLSGKTVIPFCTHAGSGLGQTQHLVADLAVGADVLDGLAIRGQIAQEDPEAAEADVSEWLEEIGMTS